MKIIDIIVIIISLIILTKSFIKLKSEFNCRLFYYWFFWLIFVVPIILDYVVGYPVYMYYGNKMIGFMQSYQDPKTRIIYAFFVVFLQIVILYHKPKIRFVNRNRNEHVFVPNYKNESNSMLLSDKMEVILIILAILGPVFCVLLKQPQLIYQFGWREAGKYTSITARGFFSLIEEWSYIGVLSALMLILFDRTYNSRKTLFIRIVSLPLLYFNLCIESKRSIIMFLLVITAFVFLMKYQNKNLFKICITLLIFASLALAASMYIKIVSRGYVGFDALYTTTRVDFFRDDTVKLVIYKLLNKQEQQVLSYPFESYIMQIGYLLGLSVLSAVGLFDIKRMGYDFYITAAVMGGDSLTDKWMTSSMYDEAIANFGLFGIIVIALFVSYYLRYIDELSKFESILWLSFLVLYTMYSLDYIIIFAEAIIFIRLIMRVRFITIFNSYIK